MRTRTWKTTGGEVNLRTGEGKDQRKGSWKVGEGPPGHEQGRPPRQGDPKRGPEWNEAHVGMKEKARTVAPAGARTSAAPGGSLKSLKDKLMTHVPVDVLMAVAREKGDRASRVSWVVRADTQIPKSFTHGAPSREKAVASDQKSATNELDSFLLPQGYDLREMWC